jgi:phosphatidylglycerophosphatase A
MSIRSLLVTGLGTGYLPIAPGTWGSAAVAVMFFAACFATGGHFPAMAGILAAVVLLSGAACVVLGGYVEKTFARKDPGQCTIDEFAGQALAYVALPLTVADWPAWQGYLLAAAVGFAAFRVFDIVKLPPARQLEKLPLGWGVLCDDLVAGVHANIVAQLVLRLVL